MFLRVRVRVLALPFDTNEDAGRIDAYRKDMGETRSLIEPEKVVYIFCSSQPQRSIE